MSTGRLATAPRIGMGCWAIGGPFSLGETPFGYGESDDETSRSAIEAAWDAGVRVFDTADVYGAGHSERLLGEVLGTRPDAVIVTKLGFAFDPATRQITGERHQPEYVRAAVDASRRRLRRDRLDVVLLHLNSLPVADATRVLDTLADMRAEGSVDAFGWSTDYPDALDAVAGRPGFVAVEHAMNVFFDAPSLTRVAERHDLVQLNRSPLAMGVLTGKFGADSRLPGTDVRSNDFDWMDYFKGGAVQAQFLDRVEAVRELLTVGGRTLGQGALCWLLARTPRCLPVPGARTPEQAIENAGALAHGPLPADVLDEIEALLVREPEGPPRDR